MFPFPPSPSQPPRRPRTSPGVTPEERGKFVLLGVLFLACLGLLAFFSTMLSTRAPAPAPEATVEKALPPGPSVEFQAVPLFPEEEAEEIGKSLLEEFGRLPPVADGVAAADPEPFDFLLDKAVLDSRVLNLDTEGFDRQPDVEKVLADPGAHRGRFLCVSGAMLSLERVPYDGKVRQVQEIRRGTLRDGKGRLWTFSWPVASALEPDPVRPGEGWVRVHGLFFKTWPAADPADPGKTVPTFHLVLQRRPQKDYPEVVNRDIDPAWMEQVHDATTAEMLVRDEDPLFHFLNLMKNLGTGGFEGWLKAKQEADPGLKLWPPEDFTGRYRELLDRPDLHRFKPVRYTGLLAKPMEIARGTIRPNPGNIDRVYFGVVVEMDWAPAIWIYSPRSLADQGFKSNDRIRVDGIFLKRVAYEREGDRKLNQAAVIVAGKVYPAPVPEFGVGRDLLLVVFGLMVILLGGLAYFLAHGRKEEREAADRRKERLGRKRVEAGGAAAGPGAEPPAGGQAGAGGPGA